VTLSPTVLDGHILALDIARFLETLVKPLSGDKVDMKPITGIAGCCARAASGHAAAAPPSSVMNSRRFN
jgi:hypothetical protein